MRQRQRLWSILINKFFCKGRWSVRGKEPCTYNFEHIGSNGDIELVDHQKLEKDNDCKAHWWTGFDIDRKFEAIKDQADKIRKDKESNG